jgi:hypothetical protein
MIERVREAFNKGALLQEFIPCPQDLIDTVSGSVGDGQDALEAKQAANREKYGYATWYEHNINEWGTKWDVGADGQPAIDNDTNTLVLNFDSAWAPPIQAYEKLFYMGFKILAYYYEPGMAFAGIFEDGQDEYYEYGGMNSDEIAEELPSELDECFCISEQVAEYESEQENIDIDLDGGVSAVNEQEERK